MATFAPPTIADPRAQGVGELARARGGDPGKKKPGHEGRAFFGLNCKEKPGREGRVSFWIGLPPISNWRRPEPGRPS